MSDKNILVLSDREHATVLNALRHWQATGRPAYPEIFEEIPEGPVAEDDIDDFVERVNSNVNLDIMLTIEGGYVTNAYLPERTERIAIHIFDLDTDGVDEDDLMELPIPFSGIQPGLLYSVNESISAPEFLALLDRKLREEAEAKQSPSEADFEVDDAESQTDMFRLELDTPSASFRVDPSEAIAAID